MNEINVAAEFGAAVCGRSIVSRETRPTPVDTRDTFRVA
jgi:hypothetical protein